MQIPGTIVRVIVDKGFGFVRRLDGDVDLFFHRSAVEGAPFEMLQPGQPVTFTEASSARGPRCARVIVS
jgi:CspA family cold shock protein